jgi:nitric oxide reductase subunit B
MKKDFSLLFIVLGLCALLFGALIGVFSSIIYISPDFLKDLIPFNQLRPMHTSSVVSWIILTVTGSIYFYLRKVEKINIYSEKLGQFHLLIFIIVGIGIYYSYFSGKMGGREYLEFFPMLTIPILIGWVLFAINFFKSTLGKVKNWPVYYWMWGTGIVFMIYHLSESQFWFFNSIRQDYIKDLTIQWKSYGSFVGSWNLLVYGTAMYLMAKIKGDNSIGRSKLSFFFYFLGLTNLMFGWAHHTYIVPTLPWIRYVAYIVSMTEWIVFIHLINNWRKNLKLDEKKHYYIAYKFIIASDIWIILNLFLALLMSIPSLNLYMHGTHITVAHSMGTTIGINTSILLASIAFIIEKLRGGEVFKNNVFVKKGYLIFYISLLVFWISLILAGVNKSIFQVENPNTSISVFYQDSYYIFFIFIVAGIMLFIGLSMIILPFLKLILNQFFNKHFYKE